MAESDGIEEAISQNIREALASAERTGRLLSRAIDRVRQIRDSMREAAERRAEARARYQAAWDKAREKLEVVDDPEWWEGATPAQIAEVYEVAVTWREHEKEADRADDVIYEEVLERFGHDLRTPSAEQVREDLEKIQADRDSEEEEEEKEEGGKRSADTEEDRERPAHDSSERRERMEAEMREADIDPDVIKARMRAYTMNGHPPREAVAQKHTATRLRGPRGMGIRARQADSAVSR